MLSKPHGRAFAVLHSEALSFVLRDAESEQKQFLKTNTTPRCMKEFQHVSEFIEGQSNEIFGLLFFSSFELVKIFSIILENLVGLSL